VKHLAKKRGPICEEGRFGERKRWRCKRISTVAVGHARYAASVAGRSRHCGKGHAFAPPDDVVRMLRASSSLAGHSECRSRLLFDSNLQPIAAGIRGPIAATTIPFRDDDFFIDLRLEPRREVDRTFLVGQVLKREDRGQGAQGMSICCTKGKETDSTDLDQFAGEFPFEFAATNQLSIAIPARRRRPHRPPPLRHRGNY